jgi:hypothetical protein
MRPFFFKPKNATTPPEKPNISVPIAITLYTAGKTKYSSLSTSVAMITALPSSKPSTNSILPKNSYKREGYPSLSFAISIGSITSNLLISNTPVPINPRSI